MKTKIKVIVLSILAVLSFAGCAATTNSDSAVLKEETLFQVSTINSLLAGNYDGFVSCGQLKQHGDVGIGTFNALDGEMVMIDQTVYKVKDSGQVVEVPNTETTPFAAVTYFDEEFTQSLGKITSLDALQEELDKQIINPASFYLFRIDATFISIKVRSVPSQQKPYPVLSEVVKDQSIFNYEKIPGTLVGLWCPEEIGGLNVKGYHFHFISDDRSKGGHLLDVSFDNAEAFIDQTNGFFMTLSPTIPEKTVDDAESAIDAVEK
jgi:acetolactate decarboxylase